MRSMLLICACCLLFVGKAFAQAPIATLPSLRGIVTIVATYGQFYTNLGAKERLCPGAELIVVRNGVVIGEARVLHVNTLDSIAELLPAYRAVIPRAGDVLIVRSNPTTPQVGRLRPPRFTGEVPRTCRPPQLPAIEPDMSFSDIEPFYTLAVIAGIILVIID